MKKGVDYIGVTICFYCHDGKGNLLLQKRSEHCKDEQGRWDCGGGSIEFGEHHEDAVRRELKEEYGVIPKKITFCGINSVFRKQNGVDTHWLAIIYSVLVNPKEVKNADPYHIDKLGWFTPIKSGFKENNLPKPLHSMYLAHLEFVKKKR